MSINGLIVDVSNEKRQQLLSSNCGGNAFSYATISNAMQPMYKSNVSNITHMHFSLLSSAYSRVKWSAKNLVLSFSMSSTKQDEHIRFV